MSTIDRIGTEAFEGERLLRPGRRAVVFAADWCPFCREFLPRFAPLGTDDARPLFADLSDLDSPLWDRFHVDVVPTVIVFQDGIAVARVDGVSGEGIDSAGLERIRSSLAGAPARSGPSPRAPRGKR